MSGRGERGREERQQEIELDLFICPQLVCFVRIQYTIITSVLFSPLCVLC